MSTHAKWVAAVLQRAKRQGGGVPDTVWNQVESLLAGKFSQRAIPAVELANTARQLLDDMTPADPAQGEPE